MLVSLCTDSIEKDLLQDVTLRSFLGQEKAGIKNREFPDLVPFPLPVSGGSSISARITGRMNN